MYAVSIEPSQAAEILTGSRPSPCRFWQTDHRGLLLIHACKRRPLRGVCRSSSDAACNALVGVVELVDCVPSAHPGDDPDEVEYHWILANPRAFRRPVPYTGRLGLFLVPEAVAAAALKQLARPARSRG